MDAVKVLDKMPGAGKSSWAFKYMEDNDGPWLYVSPYLDEVGDGTRQEGRIRKTLPDMDFKSPSNNKGSKTEDLEQLLSSGENVAITHNLFNKMTYLSLTNIKMKHYRIIIDETIESISLFVHRNTTKEDVKILVGEDFLVVGDDGELSWNHKKPCFSIHEEIKEMCDKGELFLYGDSVLVKRANTKVFETAREVIVMTHGFKNSVMYYWFRIVGINWSYLKVDLHKSDEELIRNLRENIIFQRPSKGVRELVSGYNDRLALSVSHYKKMSSGDLQSLSKNVSTLISRHHSIVGKPELLWTTFVDYKESIAGKGFTRSSFEEDGSFTAKNTRASNKYADKNTCAYLVNVFMNTALKKYIESFDVVEVNQEGYALEEMLQFILRTQLRNNKPCVLLIASPRMEQLLREFLNSVD